MNKAGDLGPDSFSVDIDPDLIAEALASVDRRRGTHPPAETPAAVAEPDIELDLSVEPPRTAASSAELEELTRSRVRLEQQAIELKQLQREVVRLREARDLLDRQGRELRKAHADLNAEFERYRGRAKRDVEDAERRGEDKVLRPVIDVFDNVERAWLHAVSDPAQLLPGLQMIVEQFNRLLGRLGFERIDSERGTLFDPTCHEAVLHVADTDTLPGTIVDEVHAGFRFRGRLFRPSRVTVAAPPHGLAD